MGKHTAGPWKWEDKSDGRPSGYDIAVLFSKGSGRRILSKYGRAGRFALGTSEEDIANARLIAAAPELLAALQTMVNGLEWHISNCSEHVNESDHEALAIANASLAKAKGTP